MDLEAWTAYITAVIPGLATGDVKIERLTGGVVNSTVRATVLSATPIIQDTVNRLPDGLGLALSQCSRTGLDIAPSFVLKYAPDHMPETPDAPLSRFRQTAEARALEHLRTDSKLSSALGEFEVAVPRLVWHDVPHHILWITDLGRMRTLTDYLGASELVSTDSPDNSVKGNGDKARAVGTRLGSVLAKLHLAALDPSLELLEQFTDPAPVGPGVSGYLRDLSKRLMGKHGAADADELSRRIGLKVSSPAEDGLSAWGMSDFWPGSVLLPRREEGPVMALVDWEFAAADHPGAEVGMMLAHLAGNGVQGQYPFLGTNGASDTAAAETLRQTIQQRCDDVAAGFVDAYLRAALSITRSSSFSRMVLQSYGREMVVRAEFEAGNLGEDGKAVCITDGIRCLRAAGSRDCEVDVGMLGDGGRWVLLRTLLGS